METGVVIANNHAVYWHMPAGRSAGHLPDSRNLWEVLWDFRESLDGFAHSHPGGSEHTHPGPSGTDVSTFEAIEAGLGKRLRWWIVDAFRTVLCKWDDGTGSYTVFLIEKKNEPDWVEKLREASYGRV